MTEGLSENKLTRDAARGGTRGQQLTQAGPTSGGGQQTAERTEPQQAIQQGGPPRAALGHGYGPCRQAQPVGSDTDLVLAGRGGTHARQPRDGCLGGGLRVQVLPAGGDGLQQQAGRQGAGAVMGGGHRVQAYGPVPCTWQRHCPPEHGAKGPPRAQARPLIAGGTAYALLTPPPHPLTRPARCPPWFS